jgi:DNA polymerase III subunit delta'
MNQDPTGTTFGTTFDTTFDPTYVDPTWPMVGHRAAVQFLHRLTQPVQVDAHTHPLDALRQAYLLVGPQQVGKRTLAHLFARAALCTDDKQRPCGRCRACHLVGRATHPDLRIIQPVDKTGTVDRRGGTLRVEQAAEIIHDVALRPMEGRYKVFLIQDMHMANDSFANKLLKTLEEPPSYALFCLTALDRNDLLPTIVSRCQSLELRPIANETIVAALVTEWQMAENEATLLGRLARGRLGWAVEQLQQREKSDQRLAQLQTLWQMIAADPVDRLLFAEKSASTFTNRSLFEMIDLWTTWWRDVLLIQSGCADSCCNIDQLVRLQQQATAVALTTVQEYLRTLQRIERYLQHTINTRLALEVLLLQLPSLKN